jgi:hypothetical protein
MNFSRRAAPDWMFSPKGTPLEGKSPASGGGRSLREMNYTG